MAQIIIDAKIRKRQIEHFNNNKSEIVKECERMWSAEEMYDNMVKYAKHLNPKYLVDKGVETALKQLCLYFTNDKRFEEKQYGSLNKSIMLVGNVGVGKTFMMALLAFNKRACFQMIKCRHIEDGFRKNGHDFLQQFYQVKHIKKDVNYFLQTKMGYCFDDLGDEEVPVRHFDSIVSVMERIVKERYDNNIPAYYTHFTCNLDINELFELYKDDRAKRRLENTVNVIELTGEDKSLLN